MTSGNTGDFIGHPYLKILYPIRTWGLPSRLGPGPPPFKSGADVNAL